MKRNRTSSNPITYQGRFQYFTAYPEEATRIGHKKESTSLFTEKVYFPANDTYPNAKTRFIKEKKINLGSKITEAHYNDRSTQHNDIVYSFEHLSTTFQSGNKSTTLSQLLKERNGDVRLLVYKFKHWLSLLAFGTDLLLCSILSTESNIQLTFAIRFCSRKLLTIWRNNTTFKTWSAQI